MSALAALAGHHWRIAFERQADRIAQRIEVDGPGGCRTLLTSLEGTSDHAWPVSPPLQNLHVETRGNGRVALLVGMAGRSHWSASVELDPGGSEAVFDIACRAAAQPEWLGNGYRVPPEAAATWTDGALRLAEHEVRIRGLEPASPRIEWLAGAGEIRVTAPFEANRWPQTLRWRYAIAVRRIQP